MILIKILILTIGHHLYSHLLGRYDTVVATAQARVRHVLLALKHISLPVSAFRLISRQSERREVAVQMERNLNTYCHLFTKFKNP